MMESGFHEGLQMAVSKHGDVNFWFNRSYNGVQYTKPLTFEYIEELVKKDLEVQSSKDCVSREAVLNAIEQHGFDISVDDEGKLVYAATLKNIVSALPNEVPSKLHGEWIQHKCSRCNYEVMPYNDTNFCPNCGADMRK